MIAMVTSALSPVLGQGKIKLRRQTPTTSDSSDTEVAPREKTDKKDDKKTSDDGDKKKKVSLRHSVRGDTDDEPVPELEYKNHSVLVGGRMAMTITSATTPNYDGTSFSPDVGIRGEYAYKGTWLGLLDLGYTQSRLKIIEDEGFSPRQQAVARADYIKSAVLGGARYNLGKLKFPRFLANKKWLNPFFVYANAGPYFNFLLTTEIEVSSQVSKGLYDYSPYGNGFVYGLQTGVGVEMQVWKLMTFIDFNYSRALADNFNRTQSQIFVTSATKEHNFIVNFGAKYLIFTM